MQVSPQVSLAQAHISSPSISQSHETVQHHFSAPNASSNVTHPVSLSENSQFSSRIEKQIENLQDGFLKMSLVVTDLANNTSRAFSHQNNIGKNKKTQKKNNNQSSSSNSTPPLLPLPPAGFSNAIICKKCHFPNHFANQCRMNQTQSLN
jgi:hypothetical protein